MVLPSTLPSVTDKVSISSEPFLTLHQHLLEEALVEEGFEVESIPGIETRSADFGGEVLEAVIRVIVQNVSKEAIDRISRAIKKMRERSNSKPGIKPIILGPDGKELPPSDSAKELED
jgi:hypothetical protein